MWIDSWSYVAHWPVACPPGICTEIGDDDREPSLAEVSGVARVSCEEGHETEGNNFRVTHQNIMKFMQ